MQVYVCVCVCVCVCMWWHTHTVVVYRVVSPVQFPIANYAKLLGQSALSRLGKAEGALGEAGALQTPPRAAIGP